MEMIVMEEEHYTHTLLEARGGGDKRGELGPESLLVFSWEGVGEVGTQSSG